MADDQLLRTFEQELRSSVEVSQGLLRSLETSESKAADIREVYRLAHSIKGTSSMVGLAQIERIADPAEDLLHTLVLSGMIPGRKLVDLLSDSLDALLAAYEAFVSGGSFDEEPLLERLADSLRNLKAT